MMERSYSDMWIQFAAASVEGILAAQSPHPATAKEVADTAARLADDLVVQWRQRFEYRETSHAPVAYVTRGTMTDPEPVGAPSYPVREVAPQTSDRGVMERGTDLSGSKPLSR